MSYKKVLFLLIIIILVAVGLNFFLQEKTVEAPMDPAVPETPLVGGDRDEHGCIGSAGYLWCESKSECLRPFEEEWDDSCEAALPMDPATVGDAPGMTACTMDAKICADGSGVGRSGPDCEFEKCPGEEI